MNRYDLVIFDLDGTLLDTSIGVLSSVRYAIEAQGLPMPDAATLASFIGPPVELSFGRVYGLEGEALADICALFRERYKTVDLLKAEAYEGIFEAFSAIVARGIKPAVATYKRESYALRVLKHFSFDSYTDILYGSDEEGKLSKRDIMEKCISVAGVTDLSRVLMVGDTLHDAVGAKALGVDFVGVTFGFGFKAEAEREEAGAIAFIDTPLSLIEYL